MSVITDGAEKSVITDGAEKSVITDGAENWYEAYIEESVRNAVKMLRDNGVNTECSCGHEGYVQCQFIPDGDLYRVYRLVYGWLYERAEKVDFEIEVRLTVLDGHPSWTMNIWFQSDTSNALKRSKRPGKRSGHGAKP